MMVHPWPDGAAGGHLPGRLPLRRRTSPAGRPTPRPPPGRGSTPATPWSSPRWPSACSASSSRRATRSTAWSPTGARRPTSSRPRSPAGSWSGPAPSRAWQQLEPRVEACFEAGALATGADGRVHDLWPPTTPTWRATPACSAAYRANAEALGRRFDARRRRRAPPDPLHRHGQRVAGRAHHPPADRHRVRRGGQPPARVRRRLRHRRPTPPSDGPSPWPGRHRRRLVRATRGALVADGHAGTEPIPSRPATTSPRARLRRGQGTSRRCPVRSLRLGRCIGGPTARAAVDWAPSRPHAGSAAPPATRRGAGCCTTSTTGPHRRRYGARDA